MSGLFRIDTSSFCHTVISLITVWLFAVIIQEIFIKFGVYMLDENKVAVMSVEKLVFEMSLLPLFSMFLQYYKYTSLCS